MSARDICVCNHFRSAHVDGRCLDTDGADGGCGCSQFDLGGTETRDKREDWVRLAALALMVERGQATIESFRPHDDDLIVIREPQGNYREFISRVWALDHTRSVARAIMIDSDAPHTPHDGTGRYHIQITTKQDLDSPMLEPRELAEAMSTTWAERAIAYGVDPRKTPSECSSIRKCIVCAAASGEWCRATHAGERDAGGWMHPEREHRHEPIRDFTDAMRRAEAVVADFDVFATPAAARVPRSLDTMRGEELDDYGAMVGIRRNGPTGGGGIWETDTEDDFVFRARLQQAEALHRQIARGPHDTLARFRLIGASGPLLGLLVTYDEYAGAETVRPADPDVDRVIGTIERVNGDGTVDVHLR